VKQRISPMFLIILITASFGVLHAQSRELWISGGESNLRFPYPSSNRDLGSPDPSGQPNDVRLDNGWRFGLRLAFNTPGSFSHEFQYGYIHPNLIDNTGTILSDPSDRMSIGQVGYNLLYNFAPRKKWREATVRPFLTAGVHVNNFRLPSSASTGPSGNARVGFNYGAGVKVRITPLFGLRGDLRGYETGKPNWGGLLVNQSGLMHQMEASAGVGIYF
jgi:opacity protein-like surface antigen